MASLLISVTHKGTVTCVRKFGGGSLDPDSIFEMTEVGRLKTVNTEICAEREDDLPTYIRFLISVIYLLREIFNPSMAKHLERV